MFKGKLLAGLFFVFLLTTFTLCSIGIKAVLPISIAGVFMLLSLIALSGMIKNKKALRHIIFILAVIIFSSAHYAAFYFINEKPVRDYLLAEYNEREVFIKAKIVKVTSGSFYTRFDLRLKEIDGKSIKYNFKLDLSVNKPVDASIDDIVETAVIFREIDDGNALYSKSNGYFITADIAENIVSGDGEELPNSFKIIPAESHGAFYQLDRFQNYAWKIFRENIKLNNNDDGSIVKSITITQEAALVYGIFIGRTEFMQQRVKTDFNRTGIAHVFSVSGLHMAIIMGSVYSFLRKFGIHKKLICVIVVLFSLVFMAFTGFTVSVVRSGIMIILYYLAFLGGRKSDAVTSLMAAGFIICVVAPYNSLNLGFQLSFLATLGIIVSMRINKKISLKIPAISLIDVPQKNIKGSSIIAKRIRRFRRSGRRFFQGIVSSMLVTVAATVFTLPLTSYRFKTISLISPVVNLLTAPITTVILILSLLILLLSYIPVITLILGTPLYFFSKAVLIITAFFAPMKYSCISISGTNGDIFSLVSLVFFILIVLYFLIYSRKRAVKIIFGSLISICAVLMFTNLVYLRYAAKDSFKIAYHSDYRNQAVILFQDDYDRADIIDMTHGVNAPVYKTYKIMLDNGATDIGSFVLTHYHKRHVHMIRKLMDYCTVQRVFVPYPVTDYEKQVFQDLFDLSVNTSDAYAKNYELFMYYDGILDLGDTTVIVNAFDYNGTQHMTTDIRRGDRKFLYLGIGYGEIYNYIGDTYDVVFYGTHKHNRKDGDFSAGIYGRYYGVLSDYIDGFGNKAFQRLEPSVLEAYDVDKEGRLISCGADDKYYPVFEVAKDNSLKYFSRKKS